MKPVSCNFCGQDDTEIINSGPDLLLNKDGHFTLVRCRQCGLIYQNPQLTLSELSNHYPDNYLPYQHIPDLTQRKEQISKDTAIQRFCSRIIKHHPQPGQLLDIGCATGDFLYAMQQRQWRVQGIEPVPYAAQQAQQLLGQNIHTGTLEDTAFLDNTFDVVTLWDVLEHLPNPKSALLEINRILKPGGLLVFSIPNPNSIEARLFGKNWLGWERPRHLHLIPPHLVPKYLSITGFRIKTIESFNGRLSLTLLSLEFMLKAHGIPEQKWRPWLKMAYTMPFRMATWPVYKIAEQFNKTTIMTIFAERPAT